MSSQAAAKFNQFTAQESAASKAKDAQQEKDRRFVQQLQAQQEKDRIAKQQQEKDRIAKQQQAQQEKDRRFAQQLGALRFAQQEPEYVSSNDEEDSPIFEEDSPDQVSTHMSNDKKSSSFLSNLSSVVGSAVGSVWSVMQGSVSAYEQHPKMRISQGPPPPPPGDNDQSVDCAACLSGRNCPNYGKTSGQKTHYNSREEQCFDLNISDNPEPRPTPKRQPTPNPPPKQSESVEQDQLRQKAAKMIKTIEEALRFEESGHQSQQTKENIKQMKKDLQFWKQQYSVGTKLKLAVDGGKKLSKNNKKNVNRSRFHKKHYVSKKIKNLFKRSIRLN